jgi:hypothetical protein
MYGDKLVLRLRELPVVAETSPLRSARDCTANIWKFGSLDGDQSELGRIVAAPGRQAVNALTLFGLFAVTAMLVTYALERRSHWFVLGFAGACALGSVYGFLQGAWPFGVVEAVWSVVAARRWYTARK